MKYYSLNGESPEVGFKEAVIRGIAPDRGLYFPRSITPLSESFYKELDLYSEAEIATEVIRQFAEEDIPYNDLKELVEDVLQFDFPVVPISDSIGTLELFHGPTMAFKDVGARFMARCLGYFSSSEKREITVLVATSGDTGGAVADGFLGVEGVQVVILYPSDKVSKIQEKQLTTLGGNIRALEVAGSFDDCQHMVKTAFLDKEITVKRQLTSANSINVARWLPQQFYYFLAYRQLMNQHRQIVFSVPSGNFGNLCAAMVAKKLGLPVAHFIAATNINDTVPRYLESGQYMAKKSRPTISNAMDVGDPSNFVRILELYDGDYNRLTRDLTSYSFTDDETRKAIKDVYDQSGYICDPHGAVGYLGLKKFLKDKPGNYGLFLETAHPVKFRDTVEKTLGINLKLPPQIEAIVNKEKVSVEVRNYEDLKSFLLS